MRQLLLILFLGFVLTANANALPLMQDSGANGIIAFEAEDYDSKITNGSSHNWIASTFSGQSGSSVMQTSINNGTQVNTNYSTTSPQMNYEIYFVKTGIHYVWARGSGASGNDDSYHAGVSNQEISTADRITGFNNSSLVWSKTTMDGPVATINVAASGIYTFNAWMREDGLKLDKFVITTSSTYTPSGTGPANSARGVPPTALNTATAGSGQVALSWNQVSAADSYKIKYGTSSGSYSSTVNAGNVTNYTVTGLTSGQIYYFVVVAVSGTAESVNSNELSATPQSQGGGGEPGFISLEPSADAQIKGTNKTTNYNGLGLGLKSIGIDYTRVTLLKFDLSGIPAGSSVDDVTLKFTLSSSQTWNKQNYVYECLRDWNESQVTFNEWKTGSPWTSIGARSNGNDLNGDYTGNNGGYVAYINQATASSGTQISYVSEASFKTLVQNHIGGVLNLVIHQQLNDNSDVSYYDRENVDPNKRPKLEINYTEPAGGPADPTLFVSNIDYNASGQMTRIDYGSGAVTTFDYNQYNLRLMRKLTVDNTNTPIQDLNYTYDSAGNILSITDNVNTATQTFTYDELNRLKTANNTGGYGAKTYDYDEIGNITLKDGKVYTYGEANAGPHAATRAQSPTETLTFTYDANGNMLTKQKGTELTEYTFDSENRLVQADRDAINIGLYEYDGDGGRTKKIAGAVITHFVGSLYEKALNSQQDTSFIYLGSERIASITQGKVYYYHSDHLGGTNVLTDENSAVKELIEYEPFGKIQRHDKYGTSAEVAHWYFTGQRSDDETGLYFYNARYYDPEIGRFITADTIVQDPTGNPQTLNRYSYTGNNPVNYIDPTGHFFGFIVAAIAAAFKGAVIGAAVGAGVAAVTGGNIGRGALFGAITGGIFAGVGSLTQSAFRLATIPGGVGPMMEGVAFSAGMVGGVLGGAVGGAAGAAYLGADPLNGAGIGALSGLLFGGISKIKGTGWAGVGRVALAGAAGGLVSEVAGGSFIDGFIFASSVASADFIYRAILASAGERQGASMKTATQNGSPKQDANGNPINGGNEIALHVDFGKNHVGNPSRSSYVKNSKEFWLNFLTGETGPVMNTLGRVGPGFQGLGLGHDRLGSLTRSSFGSTAWKYFGNFETMTPVYGINVVGSLINDNPSSIGIYIKYGRDL